MKYNDKYGLWCDKEGNVFIEDGRYKTTTLRKIKPLVNHGYFKVHTSSSRGHKIVYVHRVIAETFIGEVPQGMQIDHIDRNRQNNALSNLRIVTPKENLANRGGYRHA